MKPLLTSLLILGWVITGFGATTKASEPNYLFNEETSSYDMLGFGDSETLLQFMTDQIKLVHIGVYQQNGSGGFYGSPYYQYDKNTRETLGEFINRVSQEEFQRSLNVNGYDPNQEFSLKYYFKNMAESGQFWADKVSFRPKKIGASYTVPDNIASLLNVETSSLPGGMLACYWKGIREASLTVFDRDGSLIYNDRVSRDRRTQDFRVIVDQELIIARRLITNGYSGTLTVSLSNGESLVYLIQGGSFVYYPKVIQPLVGMSVGNDGITISVSGGAPQESISLLCYTDLSLPPHEELLTLDNVGCLVWTNTLKSPMGFFKTRYPPFGETLKLKP